MLKYNRYKTKYVNFNLTHFIKRVRLLCLSILYCSWIDAAKFLTGASAVGSLAIPIILRHAHMIQTGAMLIEFTSFFIFVCTVMCFHRASLEDEW